MNQSFLRQLWQLMFIWTLIALVPIGRAWLYFSYNAVFYILILLLGLLTSPLLLWWIRFLLKKKQNWFRIILIQLILAIGLSLFFYYVADESPSKMKSRVSMSQLKDMPVQSRARFHFFTGNSYTIFTSLIILSGLALLVNYNEQLRQRKQIEDQLKIDLALSQIKALQSELQPHFLFNTLHSISSLMESDINKAQQLIERLSFLLRHYLKIVERRFYSLKEEIDFLREYIEVQKMRHNGNINLEVKISPELFHAEVPVILLQPIIENSIKHGWTDRSKTLHILMQAEALENNLKIRVQDNGDTTTIKEQKGIGIRNLKDRLKVLYTDGFSFTEKKDKGYTSIIILPLQYGSH